MRDYSTLWKSIGLELGINKAALNEIEKECENHQSCLITMIDLWHKSVDLKPTREAVVKALQSVNITMTKTGNVCAITL